MTDHPGQSLVNFATARAALRREKIAARLALPATEHQLASRHIRDRLLAWLLPRPPGIIAFCAPVRAEVDCEPVILRLIEAGWLAAMPVVVMPAAPMQFRAWTPETPMTVDPHGIPVPETQNCLSPTVVLLPLVAFDQAGYRLGYGGGYFDRTLAVAMPRPLTVGVGFDLARVPTTHPGPQDFPLDAVATECDRLNFNNS